MRGIEWSHSVLAKFDLFLNCSQKLHGCSLARARKLFASARMLGLLLILLFSYFFIYINNKLVMIWLNQKV